MESRGLTVHQEHQAFSGESTTEIVPSWQWEILEPSSPHRMEPPGIIGPQMYQALSMESPTETVHS